MSHDDTRDPLDAFLADDPMPLPPTMPDGGFVPGNVLEPEPIPDATPETMVCLRDCRHYIEIRTRFAHGNTKGTLAREPHVINRFCRAIPGSDIELTNELVRECSEWDPEPDLNRRRAERQRLWREGHPLVQIKARPST